MAYLQQALKDAVVYKNASAPGLFNVFPDISLSMPSFVSSLRSISKLAFTSAALSTAAKAGSPPTCTNPQTSCQNTTIVQDTCCFNAPGGQLLQTQFWDSNPPTGPTDSWTIHGLWPDHCDGTFDANCDANRAYTNISAIISAAGANDLLKDMNTYWKDYQGNDESFWEHEWAKHGTCISTLEPSCYTNYVPQQEVVDFFQTTVNLYKTLPSYQWLSDAGIVPDASATYTSTDILAALNKPRGVDVAIQCANKNELDEIWYFYDVAGSVQSGSFVPTNPDGSKSDCPATGVKYLPKTGSAPSPPTTTATSLTTNPGRGPAPTGSPVPPGDPFSGKGTLQVSTGGIATGCIISGGTWYTTGTCAGFTATASGNAGFTLSSSKGTCGIVDGNFSCGSGVAATAFESSDTDDNALSYNGSSDFYASAVPSGSTQETVSTTSGATTLIITWKSS